MKRQHNYGKIREEDIGALENLVELFKKHGLRAGLHGTSLWNKNYKDLDLLVVSESEKVGVPEFKVALAELLEMFSATVSGENGDDTIGLDYDIQIGKLVLHLSYVILL